MSPRSEAGRCAPDRSEQGGPDNLIGQISGDVASDRDRSYSKAPTTHAPQHERVRAGLAQLPDHQHLRRLTVLGISRRGQARSGSSFSFWRPVAAETALADEARAIVAEIGLSGREGAVAATLAHGEQRALEVGLALATSPRLVLLDEPTAGMGPEESRLMVSLVERIRARVTVLLVEHDMDAVFRLADTVSVLVSGRVIATGTPEAVRAHAEVKRAYLGESASA
jgi:branched-chain amino acid transport system ATP-binding protein